MSVSPPTSWRVHKPYHGLPILAAQIVIAIVIAIVIVIVIVILIVIVIVIVIVCYILRTVPSLAPSG